MRPIMMERAASLQPKPRKLDPKRAPHRPNALPLQRYVPSRGFSRETRDSARVSKLTRALPLQRYAPSRGFSRERGAGLTCRVSGSAGKTRDSARVSKLTKALPLQRYAPSRGFSRERGAATSMGNLRSGSLNAGHHWDPLAAHTKQAAAAPVRG